jgi:membrane-associated phospholipid phosphatase
MQPSGRPVRRDAEDLGTVPVTAGGAGPVLGLTSPADQETTTGASRFGFRSALALIALLAGALPFSALWLLVQKTWSPLASLDGEVADDLNAVVSGNPVLVDVLRAFTDLGGTGTAVLVLALTATFLRIRRQRRLAAFVVATGLGLAVLVPATKALADRARPVVAEPVITQPENASFPSGHAMTSLVTWGVLVLLALPAVRRRARPWLMLTGGVVVLAVGFTRLALGVHFVSDVLAGWALGAAWLIAMTAAFRGWQHEHVPTAHEPLDPLEVPPDHAPRLAPSPQRTVPGGRDGVLRLAAWATGLVAVLSALGLLVTGPLSDTGVGRFDLAVTSSLLELRTETWTRVAGTIGALGGTRIVVGGGLVLAVVAMAVTRSRRPAVFVAVTLGGEVVLYFLVAQLVERARPPVADLTSGLPTGASWPSGHVAASVAMYGALAVLVVSHTSTRWRWGVLAVPALIAPAVGFARIYVAAHHPTDVVAGLVLGTCWVLVCAAVFLPRRPARRGRRPAM